MTQNYTNVFGNSTVPPAQYGYSSITTVVSLVLNWIYNYAGTGYVVTKIMEVSCGSGNSLTFPDATQVSVGEDVLVRNVGANTLTIKDGGGNTIATIAAGVAQYFYVTNNNTVAGVWGQVAFGAGSSTVSAGALVGFGLVAIASTLNVATPVLASATTVVLTTAMRAELIEFTGGAASLTLLPVATAGNNFMFYVKNGGTGLVTITPNGAEMIDGQSNLALQPNESCMIVCSGASWFTVGYGRSILYQFSQLVLDVSAAGTFTLNSTQASNKLLTFTGNPASAVTVIVPNIVAIYYIQSNISTAQNITVKTAAGTGVVVGQSQRTIAIDDGTNVSSAVSVTSTTTISMVDGSVSAPSIFFASQTNTGIFKSGALGLGVSVNGVLAINAATTTVDFPVGLTVAGSVALTAGASPTLTGTWTFSNPIVGSVTGTAASITGIETVSHGGTGLNTLTANSLLVGNGAGNVTFVAPGTAGNLLTSVAGAWVSQALLANVGQGGTGLATLPANAVLTGNGTGNVTSVAPGALGNILTSNGTLWTSAAPAVQPSASFFPNQYFPTF